MEQTSGLLVLACSASPRLRIAAGAAASDPGLATAGGLAAAACNEDASSGRRPRKSIAHTAIVTALEQGHHGEGENQKGESSKFLFHESFPC